MRRLQKFARRFAYLWRHGGATFKAMIGLEAAFMIWNFAGPFYDRSNQETVLVVTAFLAVTLIGWWRMDRQTKRDLAIIGMYRQINTLIDQKGTRSIHDWPPHLQEEMAMIRASQILAAKDKR